MVINIVCCEGNKWQHGLLCRGRDTTMPRLLTSGVFRRLGRAEGGLPGFVCVVWVGTTRCDGTVVRSDSQRVMLIW